MVKGNKKAAKEASETFHNIMKASVSGTGKNKTNMYYSRQFTTNIQSVPKEMENVLKAINDVEGEIVSVTQSSAASDGEIRITVIVIYRA
jgi:hypothetical protein